MQHVWNIQYVYLLNKYIKCSIWRLAVRYDAFFKSLGIKRLISFLILSSPLRLRPPRVVFPSRFPHQNSVFICLLPHATCPANVIIFAILPVTSSLLSPHIFLSSQFFNMLNLCSPLNVRDQVLWRSINYGMLSWARHSCNAGSAAYAFSKILLYYRKLLTQKYF